jgi:hypothetical protein
VATNTSRTIVQIGINSAREFYENVALPNIEAFWSKNDMPSAFNAAFAIWHVADWRFYELPQYQPHNRKQWEAFCDYLKQKCPLISQIRDVAEAAKHRELGRPTVQVTSTLLELQYAGLGVAPLGVASNVGEFHFVVKTPYSDRHLNWLLQEVRAFWDRELP